MRRFIVRSVKVAAALLAVCVAAVSVTIYLAFRQPGFYTELQGSEADTTVALAEMEGQVSEFEDWLRQTKHVAHSQDAVSESDGTNQTAVSRMPLTKQFTVTEEQLNAQLAASHSGAGNVQAPRLKLLKNYVRCGVEVELGDLRFVMSADLTPRITPDYNLELTLENARVGSLPFPLHSLLNAFSQNVNSPDRNFRMKLDGEVPVIVVDLARQKTGQLLAKSVQCRQGSVSIEFEAPRTEKVAGEVGQRLSRRSSASH